MKTALVIGSNSDIAKSAIELLEPSYHIIPIDRKIIDLTNPNSTAQINMALAMGQPDVVINCAGIFGDNTVDYDLTFDVNLKSNWTVVNHYINNPPEKEVRIIMLGSSVYKQGRKNFILYAASKSALYSMWQGASEFVSEKIKLGLINPVHVHTKMVAHKPHPNPAICLEPVDVAQTIAEMCTMTESRCVDLDYKGV